MSTDFPDVSNEYALQVRGVFKQFGGVPVLKDVSLDIRQGEVHALMGENGAGKSTLIKIITGVYTKDEGDIYVCGDKVEIADRNDAGRAGISVIYQELSLIRTLTVAQNIFLGREKTKWQLTKKKQMEEEAAALIERYGFDISADTEVARLGMAQRQTVEILKALQEDAKIIIMDEPTSALSAAETEKLFITIDELRSKGASVLYISHRLEEIYRIADRLTVMRDGENVGVLAKEDIDAPTVTKMMIGHEVKHKKARSNYVRDEDNVLEVRDLYYGDRLRGVSFKAYGGEILGIGGLVGSGRSELIRCIYGASKADSGAVTLCGKPVSRKISKNIKMGFGLVPEDRRTEGFVPVMSTLRNLVLPSYDTLARGGFVRTHEERKFAQEAFERYDIRPKNPNLQTINLSGGNQQKVVIGKWLSRAPQVLLLDEPTAGVDVGVKQELYNYLIQLAQMGAIVIMVSSDLPELTMVSDRIIVLSGGVVFEEFIGQVSQTDILTAASGTHTEEGRAYEC